MGSFRMLRLPGAFLECARYETLRRVPYVFLWQPGQQWAMSIISRRAQRAIPVVLGAATLADVAVLLVWDAFPALFPARSHDVLAAFSLAAIAAAYFAYQLVHRPVPLEFVKAALLAAAFLFWAANQFWPDSKQATLWNDVAIALFVLDVFLVMIGWPAASGDASFAETHAAEADEQQV